MMYLLFETLTLAQVRYVLEKDFQKSAVGALKRQELGQSAGQSRSALRESVARDVCQDGSRCLGFASMDLQHLLEFH